MLKDLIIYTPMYITFFWILVLVLSSAVNQKQQGEKFSRNFYDCSFFNVFVSCRLF